MNHISIVLTILLMITSLGIQPVFAGINDLQDSLQTDAINGATTTATSGTADASTTAAATKEETIREMVNHLDKILQEMLKGGDDGKLSEEELAQVNLVLEKGIEEIRRVEAIDVATTDSTTTTTPPPTTDTTGTTSTTTTKGVVSVNTSLNIRDGAWGNIIGKFSNGDQVDIIGQEGDWLKINYQGQIAYIHSKYVNEESGVPYTASGDVETRAFTGYVTTSRGGNMNVRSAPWGPIVGHLSHGTKVDVKKKDGEWYIVDYNGQEAYLHTSLISENSPPPAGSTPTPPPATTTPPAAGTPSTAGGAPVSGGFMFPVGVSGNSFSDTWGAARSGGRRHEGTDIFNRKNSPLVASETGRIGRTGWNNLGGNRTHVISSSSGVDYYYAHLEGFAGLRLGVTVPQGTVVGYMGGTGNANGNVHLHFGAYRGGSAFNPYPQLNATRW